MLQTIRSTPCWQLTHQVTYPDDTGIDHFATSEEALAALWRYRSQAREDDPEEIPYHLITSEPEQSEQPCVRVLCDGCGGAMHFEEYKTVPVGRGTHYAPDEVDAMLLRDMSWTTDGTRHHCPACPVLIEDGAA